MAPAVSRPGVLLSSDRRGGCTPLVYRGWGISSNMIVGIVYVGSSRNRYISKLIIYIFLGGV